MPSERTGDGRYRVGVRLYQLHVQGRLRRRRRLQPRRQPHGMARRVRQVSLELLAERFGPFLKLCKEKGVTFDLECHPSERAMGDIESASDYINFMCKAGFEGVVGFNLDGSHMEWQGVSARSASNSSPSVSARS